MTNTSILLERREPRAERRPDPATRLESILAGLLERIDGALGAAVADRDGLPISSSFRRKMDLNAVCAMATIAAQAGTAVMRGLDHEGFEAAILEGTGARVLVTQILPMDASLIIVLDPSTNLGLVRMEAKKAATTLGAILEL